MKERIIKDVNNFNDVFFVMQKQSGGQTPGLLRFNHICKDARSWPLTKVKMLRKSYDP